MTAVIMVILKWVLCKRFGGCLLEKTVAMCTAGSTGLYSYMEMNGLDEFGNISEATIYVTSFSIFTFCTIYSEVLWLIYSCHKLCMVDVTYYKR